MNPWLLSAAVLLPALLPCGVVVVRAARPFERLVALQLAGNVAALVLLLLAQGMGRPSFGDVALLLALLSLPGSLLFVHFLPERR